jgi:hypothetical protein
MSVIFDTGALVRPAFTAADFTATKWDTSEDKAHFANNLCRFMAADFKTTMFTEKMYRRLAMTFGHIAHSSRQGFLAEFFEDLRGKVAFLDQTLMWHPCGDPAWTYSGVERAVLRRLRACDLLTAYRRLRAVEVEGVERELLRRLQAKYADGAAPAQAPVLHCPPMAKPSIAAHKPAEQFSLF